MTNINDFVDACAKDPSNLENLVNFRRAFQHYEGIAWEETLQYFGALAEVPGNEAPCDVVIPVRDSLDAFKKCFSHIRNSEGQKPKTVIIIDDGSTNSTSNYLRSLQSQDIIYHRNIAPEGFTKSADQGIRLSNAEYIAVINSDAFVHDYWLDQLKLPLAKQERAALVGPLSNCAAWQSIGKFLGPDGRYSPEFPKSIDHTEMSLFLRQHYSQSFIQTEIVHGFCFMLKRSSYLKAGGLDLRNFPIGYGEVQDLSLRLRSLGLIIGVVPGAYVQHLGTQTFDQERKAELSNAARKTLYQIHGAKEYLFSEARCIYNSALSRVRNAVYGWFDFPPNMKHRSTHSSLDHASMRREEQRWRERRRSITRFRTCSNLRLNGRDYLFDLDAIQSTKELLGFKQLAAVKKVDSNVSDLAEARLRAFPPFVANQYLSRYTDVQSAGIGAAHHFLKFGHKEARIAFEKAEVSRSIARVANVQFSSSKLTPSKDFRLNIGVFCSSIGNLFMNSIAENLWSELVELGLNASLLDENSNIDERPDACIFVAPHEFFKMGNGVKWSKSEIVSNAVMVNTEQIQEKWFHIAAPYLFSCAGIVELSWQNARLFEQAAIPTTFWMPRLKWNRDEDLAGARNHPLARALNRLSTQSESAHLLSRPITISFFGACTPHREHFFATSARRLASHRNFLYLRRTATSLNYQNKGNDLLQLTKYVSRMSKIVLNIHRDELGYFEWHRIVDIGMGTGAVVLTEPCPPNPIYKAGVHYLSEQPRYIPDMVDWLTLTDDGQQTLLSVAENVSLLAANCNATNLQSELGKFLIGLYSSLSN